MSEFLLARVGQTNSEPELVSSEDLLGQLRTGRYELVAAQRVPPFAVLDYLEDQLADLTVLGNETRTPNLIQKISRELFRDGLRQHFADGDQVKWMRAHRELKVQLQKGFSRCSDRPNNLFAQARRVFHAAARSAGQVGAYRELSSKEQAEELLVPRPPDGVMFANEYWEYCRLTADWFSFSRALHAVEQTLETVILDGIEDGRIILAEDKASGSVMLPPSAVGDRDFWRKSRQIFCAFSRDLPKSWFDDLSTLVRRKNAARKWIEATAKRLDEIGQRATANQLKRLAAQEFGLTKNAADAVWRECEVPWKGESGNFPAELKVSDKEISDLGK